MRLLFINPNTSESITSLAANAARAVAAPDTEIVPVTGRFGARYISTRAASAIAAHAALDAYAEHGSGCDGVILACFGDPGLMALKELANIPVVGMAEASCHMAAGMGSRFAIVTGGERWGPMLEEFVASIGLREKLAVVKTITPSGGDIARDPDGSLNLLAEACQSAVRENAADSVILGGAGLAGLAARLAGRIDVPLIDCVAAVIKTAESLVALNLAKARSGSFATTPATETAGLSPALTKKISGR
jgi:allantoin racemase